MRLAFRAGAALAATALLALGTPPVHAAPGDLVLPKPVGTIPVIAEAFTDRPERLRSSQVPGRVDDTERIDVGVGPDGKPAVVTMTQRLVLSGTGQYVVWERSSATDVEALEDTPAPVLKREAVIWQGFVDGSEVLAARLTLQPFVEEKLLPVAVELEWRGPGRIAPGGEVPGGGEVVVRLRNATERVTNVPTGAASPKDLAGPLDALLKAGTSRTPALPPAAGRGLPLKLAASDVGPTRSVRVRAPLRVTGTVTVPGGSAVSEPSPAVTHVPGGMKVDGVLQDVVEFVVAAPAAGTLALDLQAFPTVDPRTLPPPNAPTWAQWAARNPSPADVRAATDALVLAAAASARGTDYAPYLGHHGPGRVTTTFHVSMAPASAVAAQEEPLRPKPVPIAIAGVATLALASGGFAVWRRL